MEEYLDAPVPFIIGVPRKVWESMAYKNYESDLIVYDLDNKYFIKSVVLPVLPHSAEKNITSSLISCSKQNMKIASSRFDNTRKLSNCLKAMHQIRSIWVAILITIKSYIIPNKKSIMISR
jgi:hypothetical protein